MNRPKAGCLSQHLPGLAFGSAFGFMVKDLDLPTVVSLWGNRTPWVVGFALLGALLWPTRGRRLFIVTAAALGVVWFLVAFTPLCSFLARGLPRYDAPEPADAVFVFSSYLQDDGELSSFAMSQLVHGLEVLAQGLAPRIIVSELADPPGHVASATRQLMANLRIDREVLVVAPVTNTHEEAVAVSALFLERGWSRLLVVTSPLHSRRACAAVEHEGIQVICSPSVETHFNVQRLAEPDERLRAFAPILHEWLGLWVYRQRGWIARY